MRRKTRPRGLRTHLPAHRRPHSSGWRGGLAALGEHRFESLEQRHLLTVFFESFEGVTEPDPAFWSIPDLENLGNVEILTTESANPGGQSLLFDSDLSAMDHLNEAILTVDLSATTNPFLTFYQLEGEFGTLKNDQDDFLADVHTVGPGSFRPPEAEGDGLTISNDGVTWYKLEDVRGLDINRIGDGLWQLHEYDLADNLTRINNQFGANLSLTSTFMIKWSQFDNLPFSFRGWAIDEIKIVDSPQFFDASLLRDVYHRLDVTSDPNMLYRVGLFGDVDANTPILVSVHGALREILPHTTLWQQYVLDPSNGVDSLIVVAPFFEINGPYEDYGELAYDTFDNLSADQALFDALDDITSAGLGDSSQLYMFGFSRGSHFVEAFNYVHPERVAAAVVASADRHTFPDPAATFPYGLAENLLRPIPAGESLDLNGFLSSRIMFWIGDADTEITDISPSAQAQGATRPLRMLNMFEAVHASADAEGILPANYEYELYVRENRDHRFLAQDIPVFYEFLFRDFQPIEAPIEVIPVIVSTPTLQQRTSTLPTGLTTIADEMFYVEFWVTSTGGTGIERGNVEFNYDPQFAEVVSLFNGSVFDQTTTGTFNNTSGIIRNFGGTTNFNNVGVNEFALLGRALFEGQPTGVTGEQVLLAQRRGFQPFTLDGGVENRADFLPVPFTTFVNSSNLPPVLDPIGPQTVDEGQLLTFTATASDGNPEDELTFSLGPGAPAGATIDPQTGVFQWTPPDEAGTPFVVEVIVTDDSVAQLSDSEFVQVDVGGVAPSLSIVGPSTGVPGQPREFTPTVIDSPGDQAAGFTFDVDWDGDGTFDETIGGLSGAPLVHEFTELGLFNVKFQVRDKDGLTSSIITHPVDITRFALQPNEDDPGLTNLAWGGTIGLDAVFFFPGAGNNITIIAVILGGALINQVDVVSGIDGEIHGFGLDNFNLLAAEFVSQSVMFVGGPGEDVLAGGRGSDLLDGGAGEDLLYGATTASTDASDTLLGGAGLDVIYAGQAGDSIDGGAGEDLLITGTVNFGATGTLIDGFAKIRDEWLSGRTFAERVLNISGNGSGPKSNGDFFLQPGITVFDEGAVDTVIGGDDLDWFFYNFFEDLAPDFQIDEVRTNIAP